MLATMTGLHAELSGEIDALAALTEGEVPDRSVLATRRLMLSRASAARTRFVEFEVYPHLLATLPADQAEPVRRLQAEATALRSLSSRHVAHWPIEAAMRDWPRYCSASRSMRAAMRRHIEAEKLVLYPLLARAAPADKMQAA